MEEVIPTSQPQVDSPTIETAPVETTPSISIDSHSDHPISTYDILGAAITDEEEPDVKYSLSTLWDTTEASAMPRDGGMRPWRDFQNPTRSDTALLGHERNNLRVESPHLVPSSTKSSRAPMHHDPRIAPLTINQQISAAAMREFGLRDDSPTVAHIQPEPPRRPLKSAMKRTPSSDKVVRYDEAATNTMTRQHSHTKEKQRFGRFSNFFARRSSSSEKTAQVSQLNRAASAASGFISTTNIPGLSRQRSIGWNEPIQQYHENRSVSAQSNPKARSRTANDDILGKAKTNVRRPPKGAKNWFDSFDISSDDDDVTPVELIKDDPMPGSNNRQPDRRAPDHTTRQSDRHAATEQNTRQLDRHAALEQDRGQQSQQSRFQHRQQDRIQHIQQQSEDRPSKAERILGQQTNRTADNFHNQLLPVDSHQRVLSPEEEEDYEDEYDQDATPMANQQHQQREYIQQDDGRVSALSEVSQDQDTDQLGEMQSRPSREDSYAYRDATYGYATAVNVQRPRNSRQPSDMSNKYQVERPRLKTNNSNSKVSTRSKQTIDDFEEEDSRRTKHTPKTSRSMSDNSRRGRGGYRLSSSHGYDGRGSILMDHVNAELSHMMEVTEEEMALLEMMRNKRAAMQNNNFNEGYRRALQREHEQLMQRRLLAQQTALEILRARDEMEQRQETTTDEEEIEMIVDDKEIRRLTRLRQEEMDRVLRLEKFLAMDTSMAAALQESTTGRSKSSKGSKDLSLKSSDRPSTRATRSAEKPTPRTSKSSSSFGRREVNHSKDDSMVSDWRSKSARIDIDPNLFPAPPEQKRSRRPAMEHNSSSVTTTADEPLVSRQSKAYRKSQVSGAEPTPEEARLREEIRILRAQAAERNNISTTTSPRKSVPSRKQIQATSFLRSLSDYQTPVDLTSDNSQETPSVSASVISPLTPSSLSVLQAEKRSSQGPLDQEDEILSQTSSPEQHFKRMPLDAEALRLMASKQQLQHQIQQKKKKQQQFNTLSIIEDSDRRILRNSMSSSNSAGEDVLAAWAELGGSMMPSRRR